MLQGLYYSPKLIFLLSREKKKTLNFLNSNAKPTHSSFLNKV